MQNDGLRVLLPISVETRSRVARYSYLYLARFGSNVGSTFAAAHGLGVAVMGLRRGLAISLHEFNPARSPSLRKKRLEWAEETEERKTIPCSASFGSSCPA